MQENKNNSAENNNAANAANIDNNTKQETNTKRWQKDNAKQPRQKSAHDNVQNAAKQNAQAKNDKKLIKQAEKKAKREKTTADKIQRIAIKLQRGSNEAAAVQAKQTSGFFLGVVINALGQLLYEIGFQAEYTCLKTYRAVKYAIYALFTGFFALLRSLVLPLGMFLLGIWRDLTRPLAHGFYSFTHGFKLFFTALFRGKNPFAAVAQFEKKKKVSAKHSVLHAISYVLPLVAAGAFIFTVNSALAVPFSLAVTYNDEFIGYIESDFVWDNAESTVESRIRAVNDEQTFQTHPEFEVVSVNLAARLESSELADRIMESSSDQIMQATGVYVGEDLVAVTSEGDAIKNLLETTIAVSTPTDDPTARVNFVHDIYVEDGLYYTESVTSFAQAESTLNTNAYLQTSVVVTETREVEVPYQEIEQDSDDYSVGTTRVSQYGRNGTNSLTEDVMYIDGVEVSRVLVSETVIEEPVDKITLVGTAEFVSGGVYDGEIMAGTGSLMWPVPDYKSTTTEFRAPERPDHRGLDITAPTGTAMYAADGGTVVEQTWHWSWGNYIVINHGNGMTTLYAHCNDVYVTTGMNVEKGALIATVGNTGNSFGSHLHIEVAVDGVLYNPRNYMVQP